jgi:hypothetical protein
MKVSHLHPMGLCAIPQAGIKLNSLHSKEVSHALKKATGDR